MAWKPVAKIAQEYGVSRVTILRWIHLGRLDYKLDEDRNSYYIDDEDPEFRRLLSFYKSKSVNGKIPLYQVAKLYNIPHSTIYYHAVIKKHIPYETFKYLNKTYILIDPKCPELKKLISDLKHKP